MTNAWMQVKSNWVLLLVAAVMLPTNYYWWTLLAHETNKSTSREAERAVIGAKAPPIIAQSPDGEWQRIDFSDTSNAILYVTSPQCGWCTRNIPNVRTLAQAVSGRYAFVGLFSGTGDARDYVRLHNLPFPLYAAVAESSREAYRMIGTPQTIVIENGVVVASWIGAYAGSRQQELQTKFGIALPGILSESTEIAGSTTRVGCVGADGDFYSVGRRVSSPGGIRTCGADGRWTGGN